MDQLTAEFKQETKTLKKKAKRDMQKINQNAAMIQQVYAQQINATTTSEQQHGACDLSRPPPRGPCGLRARFAISATHR